MIVPQQCFQKHDQEHHFSQSHSAFKQFSLCQQSNLQGNLLKNVNLLGNEGLLQNNVSQHIPSNCSIDFVILYFIVFYSFYFLFSFFAL